MKYNLLCLRNLFLISATLFSLSVKAQVATTYTFSQTAGTYTATSGGTVIASAALGNMDETIIPVTIPTFSFDGVAYTSINVSTNGFITFGNVAPQAYEYTPISGTDAYSGAISAFGADLDQSSGSGGKNIRTVQVGNEFVIQWQNVSRFLLADKISFQIRLNTSTNQIKIVYGGTITPDNDTQYPEVGLRGADNTFATNVNNRKVVAGTGSWINSVAGTANTSTCYFNSATAATVPAVGLTYTWTPGADLKINNPAFTTTNSCFSNNETVSVSVTNTGGSVINFATTPLTINASVSGTNPMTFTPVVINTGTLAINATQTIQIATGYDMSQSGATYSFNASLSLSGDLRVSNNSISYSVQNLKPSVSYADATICSGTPVTLNGTTSVNPYVASLTNSTPVAIPDDTPAGVSSAIVVSNAGSTLASAVSVTINNLTHLYSGDVVITLIAPNGSSIDLSINEGFGSNYINTTFSDAATDPIYFGDSPFTGTFQPESPFSGLTGSANGTWQLHVVDNVSADAGTLNSWTLTFPSANAITAYSWSPATNLSSGTISNPVATPASTTTYAVTVTDERGCTATDNVQVTVNALPTVNANSNAPGNAVCDGSSVTLTSSGTATNYTWDNSVVEGMAFTPVATTTYTVTGTDANSCSNTASVTVTVNGLPTVTASSDAAGNIVCGGNTVTLTGGGTATNYTWDNSVTDATPFTPASTNTYTITGTDANNCSNTAVITITVNAPTVSASSDATNDEICNGDFVTLTSSGTATSYSWDNGVTEGSPFSPNSTTTYTVTGTDASNCSATASVTITVNTPTVTASSNAAGNAVCDGSSVILTGSGTATNFTWDNSVIDGVAFTPASSNTYTVTGTDANGCSATASLLLTVNTLPTVVANSDLGNTICGGDLLTLTGSGTATSYTWDNSVIDGTAFVPTATTLYTVTGTDANGCSNTASINITVSAPVVTASSDAAGNAICDGDDVILTGGGNATNYAWNNGVIDATAFTPASTNTYTVTGTDVNGCSATASITIDVNSLPTVTASSNAAGNTICDGGSVILTGNGTATSYAWDNSVVDGTAFTPTSTTTYTVTGTDNGCSNTATITVTVNPLPTVTASSNVAGNAICNGNTIILTGGGTATSYSWNNGVVDGTAFTPTATTTYTVTGTDNGCSNTATITVTVNQLPVVTASSDATGNAICSGDDVILTGGGTATNYTWNNSVINGTAFTPANTNTYTVTGTDANGCSNTATITVTVGTTPTITVNAATICAGASTTLTASGATSYTWTPNGTLSSGTGASVTAHPATTTTYTVTGTDNGCSGSTTTTVTVNPLPNTALILPVTEMCIYNNPITLTGGSPAGGTYSGPGVSGASFNPASSGLGTATITYSYTDANGCSASVSNGINVDACLGIEEETTAALQAYPNPGTGLFTISVNNADQLSDIKIVDAQGKEIAFELTNANALDYTINITSAVRGIYFLTGSLNKTPVFIRLDKQ